jgi:hypothetical protein
MPIFRVTKMFGVVATNKHAAEYVAATIDRGWEREYPDARVTVFGSQTTIDLVQEDGTDPIAAYPKRDKLSAIRELVAATQFTPAYRLERIKQVLDPAHVMDGRVTMDKRKGMV